jgi:ABC transport system ATP-binding/permease protein
VLVLDEPTNDLDIETLELLEALLQEYDGTLFLVSHDRQFLDNVVTQTIAYEGGGRWKEYAGGYDDWVRARGKPGTDPDSGSRNEGPSPNSAAAAPRRVKLSYKESRELEEIPAKLEALEAEQRGIAERLADPATYQDRSTDVKSLNMRSEAIETELARLLERWEALEAKGVRS